MSVDVVVIGSGLAGAACAIHLARAGREVVLLERRALPAHKLCGEFLSPEVRRSTGALGVTDSLLEAGAVPIDRTVLTTAGGARLQRMLPRPALGLSRYALDAIFLEAAASAGARVHRGEAAESVEGDLDRGFSVRSDRRVIRSRCVIGAWGRRDRIDRQVRPEELGDRAPWVAFKAHFEGEMPANVVELHLFPGGYCGLSRVEGDRVNVCWIVHRETLRAHGPDPDAFVARRFGVNEALGRRMRALERKDAPWLSASQLRFEPRSTFVRDICLAGDAAGMIAPLCGDGMAMALDGAEIAARETNRFLTDRRAEPFRVAYGRAWRRTFVRRMRLGRWLHHLLTRPTPADLGLSLARVFPWIGDGIIRATRGH